MKRIDDKIKEIEKRDKTNRILYIIVVVLLCSFMVYIFLSEKKIATQEQEIVDKTDTINMTRGQLLQLNTELKDKITKLENSLTPEGYWANINDLGTAKAYISYITANDEDIKINYRPEAKQKLLNDSIKGIQGWVFSGRVNGDLVSSGITDLVWRENESELPLKSLPKVGDIVKLSHQAGRRVYSARTNGRDLGTWHGGTNAFVLDRRIEGDALYLKVKF